MSEEKLLTVVIPTRYRNQYPKLILSYYAEIRFPHTLFIVDSNEHREPLEKLTNSFKNCLDIHYFFRPRLTANRAVSAVVLQIQTPFAMEVGDDDLVIPQGIETCLSFLSSHPSYCAAAGETVWAKLFKKESRVVLDSQRVNRMEMSKNIEHEKPSDRLISLFRVSGQCTFSVQRSENYKKKYTQVMSMDFDSYPSMTSALTEASLGGCTVIKGKIKRVKGLSLVMIRDHTIHGESPNPLARVSMTESVSHPQWNLKMEQMIQLWANELIVCEQIDREMAQYKARVAAYTWMLSKLKMNPSSLLYCDNEKKALWMMLRAGIRNRMEQKKELPQNLTKIVKKKNKRYLGFETCYRKLQQFCEWYNPDLES